MSSTTPSDDNPGQSYLQEFIKDIELQGKSDETVRTYRSIVSEYLEWVDDPLTTNTNTLREYLLHLKNDRAGRDGTTGLSQSTLENKFSAISTYYKYLKYEGYVDHNPVPEFRERYVSAGDSDHGKSRQLISVGEMGTLIKSTLNIRDRALITVLAKTGVRRRELIQMDIADIDWENQSIKLKPNAKRSNLVVFFDDETTRVLRRWLESREEMNPQTDAVFVNQHGDRLQRNGVYQVVKKRAKAVGLHDPDSEDPEDRFTPHCCRHWFTTHLRRSGMSREYLEELRGDTRNEALDIYYHIDKEDLRQAYLSHIPKLGI